ncbi:MAG: AMP-binding protein [Bacteroidaceae bacterium]|nr:AMP-binding protein [Bacteroidaceae bacterium]
MTIHASFNKNIEDSLQKYWSLPSMSDYELHTLQYSDVAEEIAKMHILFEKSGINKGDKIALCSRNMSRWGVVFLASLTYGAVAVPILHEFHPEQIHHIINHSESKILFVGDLVWKKLNASEMPALKGIMQMNDFALLHSNCKEFKETAENLNRCFGEKYPSSFGKCDIKYHQDQPDELAVINYTSGTTSNSKGVMIPYRAIVGNMMCANELIGENAQPGDKLLSMLPLAHTLGMSFEFLFEFVIGVNVYFLTKVPTPSILLKALADIRPIALVCVPLIIEKVIRKAIMQKISDPKIKLLLKTPIIGKKIKKKICEGLRNAFGGNFYEVVIGGAALNQEVEAVLHDIGFNFTVGYGATECAPLISCADWKKFIPGSCGKIMNRMEVKIDSRNPYDVPGEILVKGQNVMLGYYKNPEATAETLVDGWYHTGDLGIIDRYGNIFIKGRIKNMLLSGNGQNIYPEEIEDKLNNLPYVQECVVVQRDDKLYGLVYPDPELIKKNKTTQPELEKKMEDNRKLLNSQLANYEQLAGIILQKEEFEKTPKRSIKRFLYS